MKEDPKSDAKLEDSPEYSELLKQYGIVMAKAARLESEVDRLSTQLSNVIIQSSTRDSVEYNPISKTGSDNENDEVINLRIRLNDMAGRLASAQDQMMKSTSERRSPQKRRRDLRPWWKRTLRRLGIRRSRH